ncbi:fatty acid-binding protein, intestinal-like [Anguilla rostrata]|uniref:fatty acid-binding protein, intestinal-like n=1 Tax=Anguilla anguilla TaxID=7936 RepID=UPI0015B2632A|nr:fatty acid-binding protein, intestinal-like [Anguilla anguilla]XP_035282404.1 fatty acid-binding protein, intestinal-like [Anguilla anguilla]XP_035282405.1 fatty acid-binding protein, intestinal-like [Anguilla anguilla]
MTFNGTWKTVRSENMDKFLDKMGINIVMRKLAEHDNLEITIEQTGDKFKVKESSTFRTKVNEFTLGVPYDYTLADGNEVTGVWIMEGEMMKGTFSRKDDGKEIAFTREIVDGELVQSFSYDGVDAKKIFKKV